MEAVSITSQRLALTPIRESDIDTITEICQDPTIQKWTTVPSPYTRADAETFVRDITISTPQKGDAHWAIRLSEDSPLIGVLSVVVRDGVGTIGFWLAPEHRGNGYVTEATNAALDFFFDHGCSVIRWDCAVIDGEVNWASARVAWACGFTFEGVRRGTEVDPVYGRIDSLTASILAGESRSPKAPWQGPTTQHPAFDDPRDPEALVRQFHATYGLPVIENEPDANRDRIHMRLGLVAEEFCELVGATYGAEARSIMEEAYSRARQADDDTRDTVEVADALGDIVYVCYGMALEMGIPMREVLAEIQGSNLSKLGADGKPIYREDGKVLKGPNYYRPDIRKVLGL